jgi:hypothetical protein
MNITFPKISTVNLEGVKFELPGDFKGKLNIIIIAFKREQQDLINEWIPFMEGLVNKNQNLAYYELPTLKTSYSLFRGIIDGGMRAGIPDKNARERTITLYLNKKAFMKELDIPDEKTIYILLINKEGKIIWRTRGGYSREKFFDLENAILFDLQTKER